MIRLTDRLDMTIAVDWDVKPRTKQTKPIGFHICFGCSKELSQ